MRVMLVDDHSLFLEGLHYLLETHGIDVIGIAKSGEEALQKARSLKPEIILMDIRMPQWSGLDTLKLMKAEMPEIKVIMLTTSDDDADLFEAIKYGASGYLLKSLNADELVKLLSSVENNEAPFSSGLAAKLLTEFRRDGMDRQLLPRREPEAGSTGPLTGRQLEILEMVAGGKTYKEVGSALGITERTVKYHMGKILELLHLENRAQVIAYATRLGIGEEQ
jgi:DNA-binding NarL/FixJ family response regulator